MGDRLTLTLKLDEITKTLQENLDSKLLEISSKPPSPFVKRVEGIENNLQVLQALVAETKVDKKIAEFRVPEITMGEVEKVVSDKLSLNLKPLSSMISALSDSFNHQLSTLNGKISGIDRRWADLTVPKATTLDVATPVPAVTFASELEGKTAVSSTCEASACGPGSSKSARKRA